MSANETNPRLQTGLKNVISEIFDSDVNSAPERLSE